MEKLNNTTLAIQFEMYINITIEMVY